MAAPNGRGLRPGGVVRALGRLSLLVSFGFAAGLLIGVLLEEPELLAGHLRGEGEAVVLAAADHPENFNDADNSDNAHNADNADNANQEDGATRASLSRLVDPSIAVDRIAMMEDRASEKPERSLPAVAAAAAKEPLEAVEDQFWAIQVGAFSDEAAAARLVVGLDAKGYPTELVPSTKDSQRWRVRVQPVRGKSGAKEMADRLKRLEGLPTWVLPMEGRPR